MIFRADDLTRRVGDLIEKGAVRDNVLFETGLFYGHLGSKRVFILEEKGRGKALKVASDLYGMLRLTFDSPKSFAEQMKVVLETMQDRSTQWYPRWTPAASLAIGYVKQFVEPFVTKCVDTRRAARQDKDFVLEVLLPTEDFRSMTVPECSRVRTALRLDLMARPTNDRSPGPKVKRLKDRLRQHLACRRRTSTYRPLSLQLNR